MHLSKVRQTNALCDKFRDRHLLTHVYRLPNKIKQKKSLVDIGRLLMFLTLGMHARPYSVRRQILLFGI